MSTLPQTVPTAQSRVKQRAIAPSRGGRPWTFYVLAGLFTFYVVALYGPMICIYILSFQDVRGGLVFPMKGLSLHWFVDLFTQVRTGDVRGAFDRSIKLAILVTAITVVVSFMAAMAFRRRFPGDNVVFSLMIGSLWRRVSCLGSVSAFSSTRSASKPPGTVRRSVRSFPGRCHSACW